MSSNMIINSQNIRFPFENYRIHCNAGDRLISMCINYHFHVNSEQNQEWDRANHYTLGTNETLTWFQHSYTVLVLTPVGETYLCVKRGLSLNKTHILQLFKSQHSLRS